MKKLMKLAAAFWNDETGATAIEYGLMVGLIAAVIVAVVAALGTTVKAKFCLVLKALDPSSSACS